MDPNLQQEVLDVRKVIEKSTSKVSLRDLEKKGFRQVKVLRAGDINQLIMKAVQNVLAKAPRGAAMSEEERQRIMKEARAELDRQMAEKKQIQQAHVNLQQKLQEVNQQLTAEKQAFQQEKQAFERQRQALMEKSLEGQKVAAQNYEGQINELRQRLAHAESNSGVSKDEYEAVRKRYAAQLEDMENDCERYRKQIRTLEEEGAAVPRLKARISELEETEQRARAMKQRTLELEEAEGRAQSRARSLSEDVQRLEQEVSRLKAELEQGGGKGGGANQAELQRMRMEFEQSQSRMQDMMAGIANSLINAKNAAPAESPDLSKQFKALQQNISDAVRKASGGMRGSGMGDMDLTAEQASALFATMLDDAGELETNVADVEIKSQKAASVSNKLAKLRNLRKK